MKIKNSDGTFTKPPFIEPSSNCKIARSKRQELSKLFNKPRNQKFINWVRNKKLITS